MKFATLYKYRFVFSISVLFLIFLFFRVYQLEERAVFGWDQVNNAWAAVRILVEGKYPLLGMVAKLNSGLYIGPLYYYLVALFYWVTHLDPIASPILGVVTSIASFFVLLTIGKKLFNEQVATIALLIFTFSEFIISTQRVQWPVNFVPPLSLVILYFLYQVVLGKWKYILYLSFAVGLSFHVHFTSIYYPLIILLALPLIPYSKKMWKYVLWAVPLFIAFFIPQIVYFVTTPSSNSASNYSLYFQDYFHGLHLRRVLQIAHDGFIEFESIFKPFKFLRPTVFFYLPLFAFLYAYTNSLKKSWKLLYLFCLWFIVPWIVLSTYRGELTDYYFYNSQYIVILILSYITFWLFQQKKLLLTIGIFAFWATYGYFNVTAFFKNNEGNLKRNKVKVEQMVKESKRINFTEGDPESYLFYFYTSKQ